MNNRDKQIKKLWLDTSLTKEDIAVRLGCGETTVRRTIRKYKLPPRKDPTIDEVVEYHEKKAERDLKKEHNLLLERVYVLQSELEAAKSLKRYTQTEPFKIAPSSGLNEATAVVMASDWHVEEKVRPESVSGLNKYTLEIAEARAGEFFSATVKLLRKEQRQIKIPNMVLFLGGDFISGYLREEDGANCQLLPMEAAKFAKRLLKSGIQTLLKETECNITVVCCVGNHGRTTKKVHWSNEQGNSLETFIYHGLSGELDSKRLTWVIGEGYHTLVEIYGRIHRFHHGHAIRYLGGIGGLFVPALRAVAQWNQSGEVYMDYFGHHHTQRWGGNFLSNGSMIGYNSYAVSIKAPFEPPRQTFAIIDAKRGLTTITPIVFSK